MDQRSALALLVGRWERRTALDTDDRAAVLALPVTIRPFSREGYIVREGDRSTTCSLLVSGFAYRQKLIANGARQIISISIPGEFVDLQNLVLDVADHGVQSLARTEVAQFPKPALVRLMGERPAIARAVWQDTLIDASIFREWVVNVGRRDAITRIAHLLCELTLRLRLAGLNTGDSYRFPFTQEQIADATGLTAVHTNRVLQVLRRRGLIRTADGLLTVLDWRQLADVGDFSERYLHHHAG